MKSPGLLWALAVVAALLAFATVLGHAAEEATITEKSDSGAYLQLDDGTEWVVDEPDRATSATWQVGDDVIYTDNSKDCDRYKIIDTDDGDESVCAAPE